MSSFKLKFIAILAIVIVLALNASSVFANDMLLRVDGTLDPFASTNYEFSLQANDAVEVDMCLDDIFNFSVEGPSSTIVVDAPNEEECGSPDYHFVASEDGLYTITFINGTTDIVDYLFEINILPNPEDTDSSPLPDIIIHKFYDLNGNGVQDDGEEDIAGWTMRVYRWDEGRGPVLVAEGLTDEQGNAYFEGLEPGRYKAWEADQECWTPTTPGGRFWDGGYYLVVYLQAGDSTTVEFGNADACVAAPSIGVEKYVSVDDQAT